MTIVQSKIRIGVDVGGTNTDAVVVDLSPGAERVILAATKTPTTSEVSLGVQKSIETVLDRASHLPRKSIQSVNIGTTHFVNALIQRSATHLERVAVIRLCGSFTQSTPPFAGFPYELRALLEGPHFFVNGGLQIDGSQIAEVDVAQIERVCEEIKAQGIRCVAISAVYAPIDFNLKQEEQVEAIVRRVIPGIQTSISKQVANYGLLERENATILNASLLPFASTTVRGFQTAARKMGLPCPFFVTGNDGTLLTLSQAARLPIKTFSSGPTNSMRGANFLAQLSDKKARRETALVVDIGGTTTEVGVLLPSGFPRQAANHHEFCGVRINFAMPQVASIGLGGGSLVRYDDKKRVSVGPTSVGYKLIEEGLVFGGKTLTATDIAVAVGDISNVGDEKLVSHLDPSLVNEAKARIELMLELTLDSMKTSSADIPVYLVGGGTLLAPDTLAGVSKVYRLPHCECANAVGAAIAQISGTIDAVEGVSSRSVQEVRQVIEQRAIDRAIAAGAEPASVTIVESETLPVAYVQGQCRFFVKAAGEWNGISSEREDLIDDSVMHADRHTSTAQNDSADKVDLAWHPENILAYRPKVIKGEWLISEIDLRWIGIGAFILGCGGGGDPHQIVLAAQELVRAGAMIRVIDYKSLASQQLVGWGGSFGSPEVISERLVGQEYNESLLKLWKFVGAEGKVAALAGVEIGGSNGVVNGRAYPTAWQTTPNVYDTSGNGSENTLPLALCSGDGSSMFVTEVSGELKLDSIPRIACTESCAYKPISIEFCKRGMIKNTISLSWRLGRAVMLAERQHNIGNIGQVLVDAVGGPSTAKVLFAGKITGVERKTFKGHTIGEVQISALKRDEQEDDTASEVYSGTATIPFKNENLYCQHELDGKVSIIATVPDLICVIDAQNGQAMGSPDYKYGRKVVVLGITAAPQWTDTERGLSLGDMRAFGFDDMPYVPIGTYVEPSSIIDEFGDL